MAEPTAIVVWSAGGRALVPASVNAPQEMVPYAIQLSQRDRTQLTAAFASHSYEMATTFVWTRAIAALRRRLASLGMDFVGQMLSRADIDENSSIDQMVTDYELVSLAEDLGIFTSTEALRVRHAQELVTHFAGLSSTDAEQESMRLEEAVVCLRASIDAILGHEQIEMPTQFIEFRKSLGQRSYRSEDLEVQHVRDSPEFFKRTVVSVLLSLLNTGAGAAVEHACANVQVFVPAIWSGLSDPLKWQIGQAYARFHSEGAAKVVVTKALGRALVAVGGFDFVPETLRSQTYASAARAVLQAHEGWNNFHNEPPAMAQLMSLGSSIPMPAMTVVATAVLSVYLGRKSGVSYDGVAKVEQLLSQLDVGRWRYLVEQCLPRDRQILYKLVEHYSCRSQWMHLVSAYNLMEYVSSRNRNDLLLQLVEAGQRGDREVIRRVASLMYSRLGPSLS